MKPFSQELYNNNDWVKHLMVDILNYGTDRGARINANKYGIDVITDRYDFEVEIKHNWKGHDFPYDTIHYASRKRKFCNVRSFFVTFNSDATRYFITHSSALIEQHTIIKDTSLTGQEAFIEVPVRLGNFHDVPTQLRKAYP
jgi:hypothetical protein